MSESGLHLELMPSEESAGEVERDFGLIEGRLDVISRLARFLGSTLLVTFIIGLVGALVLHATIIEDQQDLDARRAEISTIAAETEVLLTQLAELEAPERIVDEARDLGMIEAPSIVYLTSPPDELDPSVLNVAANQLQVNE